MPELKGAAMPRCLGLVTLVLAVSLPLPAAGADNPRVWNGLDPFHSPAATTDFYGSGDVDLDGKVRAADVSLADAMAQRRAVPSYRADADFDGDVDARDVELLRQAVGGRRLPAQWDLLATRAQREAQITRILARDRTNEHPGSYWFQSLTAAALPDGSVGIVWSVPRASSTSIGTAQVAGPP